MKGDRDVNSFGTNGATQTPSTIPSLPALQPNAFSGLGTVYTFSLMYSVPQGFEEQKPYVIAIVKLDEGPMVTAQLTDINHHAVEIGLRVEMVTRKLREEGTEGQIIYGYKFRPLLQESIDAG